jgi:hypothetical protein
MPTPTELIARQIATLEAASLKIMDAIDDLTASVDPDNATWADACRLNHLVDAVRRAELAA